MITNRLSGTFAGQKMLFSTILFGKSYFWMEDGDGVTYLVKAKAKKDASVDGQTGEATEFLTGLVPDFS